MTAAGGLTVLVCDGDHTASKGYTLQPDGNWKKTIDYDLGFWFRPCPYDCADLHDLADLIGTIREGGNACLIRGELDQAAHDKLDTNPDYKIARRKNPKPDGFPAHLSEAARQWIMVDIDGYPLPPSADLATDPAHAINGAIHALLPEQFHDAECFWQLSASAGFVAGILKVHLFFWMTEAHENADLRQSFKWFAPCVDIAPFNAVQPHFITDPKLTGGTDPLPARTGWIPGTVTEVALPDLPPEPERIAAHGNPYQPSGKAGAGLHAASIADALQRLGDGDGRDGFHAPLLAASMQYCLRCQKGGIRNDQKFIADLRAAIEAAPKRDGRDIADYLGDPYMRRIIDGAFCLIANAAKSAERIDVPPIPLPAGFGFARGGLWFTDPNTEAADPVWVCQQFNLIGKCKDAANIHPGLVLQWQDDDGLGHTWIVPQTLLHGEPKIIAQQLADQDFTCNYNQHGNLRRCLASLRPERRLTAVERAGWHGASYLLPDGSTYGAGDVMLRPELQRADLTCATAGSLQDWQQDVARFAVGNSRLGLFLSAAFAGALLDIIAEPSGGFHLYGQSQRGKSTAAFVAASVNGKGARDGACHQWRSTGNGLEAIAARCSDSCLVLDEISQTDAREAGDMIYMLSDEQGKQRADRTGGARQRANWHIIFLSTGEVTLQQRMSDANKRTMTGMEVRLVNIPSDAGADLGVFETLHEVAEAGLLADQLRAASARFYGVAGRAFLERLVAERAKDADGFYGLLKARRIQFIADHLPIGSDGQVRSVCGRFGVIAAAGELATEWNILPFLEGEATKAAVTCFKAWLGGRGGIGAGEEQAAIRQVRQFFEAHGASRFTEIRAGIPGLHQWQQKLNLAEPEDHMGELRTLNRVGWRRRDPATDQWTYFVLPESWKAEVCRGIDSELAAKALLDKGWLQRGEGRNLKKKVSIPEHGQIRLYVVSGALLEGDPD